MPRRSRLQVACFICACPVDIMLLSIAYRLIAYRLLEYEWDRIREGSMYRVSISLVKNDVWIYCFIKNIHYT